MSSVSPYPVIRRSRQAWRLPAVNTVVCVAVQVWVITAGRFWLLLVLMPLSVMFAYFAYRLWREASTGEVLMARDREALVGKVLRKPLPVKSTGFRLWWVQGSRLTLYRDGRVAGLIFSTGWAVDGRSIRGERLARTLVELGLTPR